MNFDAKNKMNKRKTNKKKTKNIKKNKKAEYEIEADKYIDEYNQLVDMFSNYSKYGNIFEKTNTANILVNEDKVLNVTEVKGVNIKYKTSKNKVKAKIIITEKIKKPIHVCFGVLKDSFIQNIDMEVIVEKNASAKIISHCFFPKSKRVKHIMKGLFLVKEKGSFNYFEEHFHNDGAYVDINLKVKLLNHAKFKSDFKLRNGSVGEIKSNYYFILDDYSYLDSLVSIYGRNNDKINIIEKMILNGVNSKGTLKTNMVLKNNSSSLVDNEIIAKGKKSYGHIECKELLLDKATAKAIPVANVLDKTAKITHEASIGTIDNEKIEYIMSKGISKQKAIDIIVKGMLK